MKSAYAKVFIIKQGLRFFPWPSLKICQPLLVPTPVEMGSWVFFFFFVNCRASSNSCAGLRFWSAVLCKNNNEKVGDGIIFHLTCASFRVQAPSRVRCWGPQAVPSELPGTASLHTELSVPTALRAVNTGSTQGLEPWQMWEMAGKALLAEHRLGESLSTLVTGYRTNKSMSNNGHCRISMCTEVQRLSL